MFTTYTTELSIAVSSAKIEVVQCGKIGMSVVKIL